MYAWSKKYRHAARRRRSQADHAQCRIQIMYVWNKKYTALGVSPAKIRVPVSGPLNQPLTDTGSHRHYAFRMQDGDCELTNIKRRSYQRYRACE
jgi:hypothetical protein